MSVMRLACNAPMPRVPSTSTSALSFAAASTSDCPTPDAPPRAGNACCRRGDGSAWAGQRVGQRPGDSGEDGRGFLNLIKFLNLKINKAIKTNPTGDCPDLSAARCKHRMLQALPPGTKTQQVKLPERMGT
eukprot:119965-Chlamydomonas_euryale.AAC.1